MGLNKKLIYALLICCFLVSVFHFPTVFAVIYGAWAEHTLEDIETDWLGVNTGNSNCIFYCEENDRWYSLYHRNYALKYSYSDVGDVSTQNAGGFAWASLIGDSDANNHIYSAMGNWFSWDYDEEHDIGHLFFAENKYGEAADLYYRNFTLSGGGSLVFGDVEVLYDDVYGASNRIFVNMALDENNLPLLVTTGYYDDQGEGAALNLWAWKPDSYEVYGGGWTVIEFNPNVIAATNSPGIIPMGDNKVLIVVVNCYATEPMYYLELDFDTATNGSLTLGSGFTDESVQWNYLHDSSDARSASYGFSYNSTHAGFVYTDAANITAAYAFNYKFSSSTKGTEYNCLNAAYEIFPDMTIHENEFFVFGYGEGIGAADDTFYANEYSNGGATPWDVTNQTALFTDDSHDYNPTVALPLFAADDGEVIFEWFDDDTVDGEIDFTYGIIEGEFPYTPFEFSVSVDLEDIDDGGADWVFTDWKYYTFTVTANLTQLDNASIMFAVPTGEEEIWCGFWSDGDDWTYESNMTYESREGEPCRLRAGSWNETSGELTFPIWFESRILDVWDPSDNVDVYGSYNASEWFLAETNLFRIYSKGGFEMNFASTGDAGKLDGGTPFSLYGNNGSIVYNEIWYRDVQHIKLMPDIHFLTGLDPFYVRYGVDYSLGDGEWLEGWAIYINPKFVSYTGIFAANVWINMTNLWMNRGSYVDDADLYMFYHGSVSGVGDPGHWKSWVDLWFSDKNASRVGAGRYNAYEFPMIDSADLWLRWLANNWGVKDNVLKEMSMEAPLYDADNATIVSSESVKMMRFWCELEVDDADSGQYVSIENYEAFDVTHSRDLPLVGMPAPVFDETLLPTVGQRGILGALFSMFAGLGQWLSKNIVFGGLNLWGTFVNFLDTIAAMFGAPKFFSNLFDWIYEAMGYVYLSFEYVLSIVSSIFSLMGVLLAAFLTTMADIITSFVNAITMFTDMMAGGYGVGVDLWETFGISQWITVAIIFYPIYLVILWDQEGMDAVMKQLYMMFGILSWLFGFFVTLIQFVIRLITTVIESIPVAE